MVENGFWGLLINQFTNNLNECLHVFCKLFKYTWNNQSNIIVLNKVVIASEKEEDREQTYSYRSPLGPEGVEMNVKGSLFRKGQSR